MDNHFKHTQTIPRNLKCVKRIEKVCNRKLRVVANLHEAAITHIVNLHPMVEMKNFKMRWTLWWLDKIKWKTGAFMFHQHEIISPLSMQGASLIYKWPLKAWRGEETKILPLPSNTTPKFLVRLVKWTHITFIIARKAVTLLLKGKIKLTIFLLEQSAPENCQRPSK